jgi:uncharacterized membrane protein YvbJ
MLAQEMTETTGIKKCHACGAELLERDKFCRRCGVSQGVPTSTLSGVTDEIWVTRARRIWERSVS